MSLSRLPFRAKFDGGVCPGCDQEIVKGQSIQYNDNEVIEHEQCELPPSVALDSAYYLDMPDAMSMHDDVGAVLTLQRPICKTCFLELPTSRICGNCC